MNRSEAIALLKIELPHSHDDAEISHKRADKVLCELLTELGFGDVVAEYEKVEKWYA